MARTKTLILLNGDYSDRLDDLWRQAVAIEERERDRQSEQREDNKGGTRRRLGAAPQAEAAEYERISGEYDNLKAEAEAAGTHVTLRALRDDEWDELVEAHPARGDDDPAYDSDKALGFNEKTGRRALVQAGLVAPAFESRAKFDTWVRERELSRGDVETMALAVWNLTNRSVMDPKSLPGFSSRGPAAT
jgi:hypothetical protein